MTDRTYILRNWTWEASVTAPGGTTYTFDTNGPGPGGTYKVFQDVSGAKAVKLPCTVASVSPAWDGTKNGSVLDMGSAAGQGFYNNGAIWTYDGALRASFPLTVEDDGHVHRLISTIGLTTPNTGGAEECISDASVLTFLPYDLPADAFVPSYYAGADTLFRLSEANFSFLTDLELPEGANLPGLTGSTGLGKRWLHNAPSTGEDVCGVGACLHASNNMPPYPVDAGIVVSDFAAAITLNTPYRALHCRRMLRLGIDLLGIHLYGPQDAMKALGGFGCSWLFPIAFAAKVFGVDRVPIRPLIATRWGGLVESFETGHFYVNGSDRPMWGQDAVSQGFTPDAITKLFPGTNVDYRDPGGTAEISPPPGHSDVSATVNLTNGGYRVTTVYSLVGQVYAANKLGMRSLMQSEAMCRYVEERWLPEAITADGTNLHGSVFVEALVTAYGVEED